MRTAFNRMGTDRDLEEDFLVNNAVTESVCLSSAFFKQSKHESLWHPFTVIDLLPFYASRRYYLHELVVPSLGELRK